MARVLAILILAVALVDVKADEECVCAEYTEEELKQTWDFFKEAGVLYGEGVSPGLLAPLIPCGNCVDNSRKKRTVLPPSNDLDEVADINEEEDNFNVPADSRCPVGYARIAFRCINMSHLYK